MLSQKGGETLFTRKMKKAKKCQIIKLNEVKIFDIGDGKNNKNTFKNIFKGSHKNKFIANCSVVLRFEKKTKTGNFKCAMPIKYKKYFEGGLFSKQRTCYKLQFLGARFDEKSKNISNIEKILNNCIRENIYIVTFSRLGMSIGYFIIDNYLLYFETKNKKGFIINKNIQNSYNDKIKHSEYTTFNKKNMDNFLKQFSKGYKLEKSENNNKRGLNKNFAKKILSNNINENTNSYINKEKEEFIKDYLPITKSLIDKIQKNGDIEKLNSYAPKFITNLFYNFLYLNTTKNNDLKEMFRSNIDILGKIYLKNRIEFDSDGKIFYSLREDLKRSSDVILKINGQEISSGLLKIDELFKKLNYNLSNDNFNRNIIKPNRKIIENLSNKTTIPVDNLLILSNIINQGTITPFVGDILKFLPNFLLRIIILPTQVFIQREINFNTEKNEFTEIHSNYFMQLSIQMEDNMFPLLICLASVNYDDGDVSYNISPTQKGFFETILDLPDKINDNKYLVNLNKKAQKIIDEYKHKADVIRSR